MSVNGSNPAPDLLAGKRLLITGVVTRDSIAFEVAWRGWIRYSATGSARFASSHRSDSRSQRS